MLWIKLHFLQRFGLGDYKNNYLHSHIGQEKQVESILHGDIRSNYNGDKEEVVRNLKNVFFLNQCMKKLEYLKLKGLYPGLSMTWLNLIPVANQKVYNYYLSPTIDKIIDIDVSCGCEIENQVL